MNINFTPVGIPDNINVYLCNPNKKILYSVNGINRNLTLRLNDLSEFTIDVYKNIQKLDGEVITQPCYEYLQTKRLLLIENVGYFIIKSAIENIDKEGQYISIVAESHQAVLKDKGFETEERVYKFFNSVDPMDDNYDANIVGSTPSIVGQLYQQLGIAIDLQDSDVVPSEDYGVWTLTYIDNNLRYSDENAYRSFEKNSTNGYDFMLNTVQEAYEILWIFDFLNHTIKAKYISSITLPTDIYLSMDNLLENIEVTEDAESIITVLNCEGSNLDIRTVNPMGTNYLVDFDYYKDSEGKWMSQELITALDLWNDIFDTNKSVFANIVLQLKQKYLELTKLNTLLSNTQLKITELNNTRDQYITNFPILSEEVLVGQRSADLNASFYDNDFSMSNSFTVYKKAPTHKIVDTSSQFVFSGSYNLGNLEDCFNAGYLYFQDNDASTYCKLIKTENNIFGYQRFGSFNAVKDWCNTDDSCDAVVVGEVVNIGSRSLDSNSRYHAASFSKNSTTIIRCYANVPSINENGEFIGGEDYMDDTLDNCLDANYLYFLDGINKSYCKILQETELIEGQPSYYVSGFYRFTMLNNVSLWIDLQTSYNNTIEQQIKSKNNDINTLKIQMKDIAENTNVRNYIKNCNNGDELLKELDCYWICGDYSNDNYSVDDSTTLEDTITLANKLLECGEVQMHKVSQPSFSFTVKSIDFTKLKEFEKFAKQISLGKTITIEKEEDVLYYPALTEITMNLDSGDEFSLTFSSSARLNSNDFTFADLISKTSSVTKSVQSNWQDLMSYAKNKEKISDLIINPLNRSLRAGISGMVNQEFTIDTTGILGRKYSDDTHSSFLNEQMRILNNTILFTDDNWSSVKTALGKIYYTDEGGTERSAYGLVAQTIIGSLLVGETLRITNANSSVKLDADGIIIKQGENIVFRATTDGNVNVSGRITATSGYIGSETDGFLINSNSISKNLQNASSRVMICSGEDTSSYIVTGRPLSNIMLLAGENFAVTNNGSLYANTGYLAELELKKEVGIESSGDYVKVNNEYVLLSSLTKYLKVYMPDVNGTFVRINDEYVLGSTLTAYNPGYEIYNNGVYVYVDNNYTLASGLAKYNLVYNQSQTGQYLFINNDYILNTALNRYQENYVEDVDGEFIIIDDEYTLLSDVQKYEYDLETETYIQTENGSYIYNNDEYLLISELVKYTHSYIQGDNGAYVFINNEYVLYSSLTKYVKEYESNESGLYVLIPSNYNAPQNTVVVNNEYILLSELTRYRYVYDVMINGILVGYFNLQKYTETYQENNSGDYVLINQVYRNINNLIRYSDENGTTNVIQHTVYGLYSDSFKIETNRTDNNGDTRMVFWSDSENDPEMILTGSGIKAKEANFTSLQADKTLTDRLLVNNNMTVGNNLIISSNRISSSVDNSYFQFGFSSSGASYYAKLWWNWWERILRLNIYDSNGNAAVNTGTSNLNFRVNFAVIWGGNTVWNASIAPGKSGATKDTGAFWGIDYGRFDATGNGTQWFRQGDPDTSAIIGVNGNLTPVIGSFYDLGGVNNKWRMVYAESCSYIASDRNLKNTIESLDIKYSNLFDRLNPVSFKYNNGTSDRIHIGLIAQEVEEAILHSGLTTQDFAGLCYEINAEGNKEYGLRYGEFIGLCIKEIQTLKQKVLELEQQINNNTN